VKPILKFNKEKELLEVNTTGKFYFLAFSKVVPNFAKSSTCFLISFV